MNAQVDSGVSAAALAKPVREARRLLVPINIRKCPLEVFSTIREFGGRPGVSLTLLHVIDPESLRADSIEQAQNAAKENLNRLANRFVPSSIAASTKVCVGKPAEEIPGEAQRCRAELLVLTSYTARKIASDGFRNGLVGKVIKSAPCSVSLLQVRTYFDCEKQWNLVDDVVAALNYVGLLRPANRWTLTVLVS